MALILVSLYGLVALIISLLAIGTNVDDEDIPVGFAVAGGVLWLPIVIALVLVAGVAALLRERA